MLKFLLKVSIFLIVPIGIMCLNFTLNPGLLFRGSGIEDAVVKELLQQKKVAVNTPLNLRVLRNTFIEQDSEGGEVVIFGGSTIIELGNRFFDSTTIRNYAVLEPSIKGQLALYNKYLAKDKRAKHMLLAVNPFLFYEMGPSQDRWIPIKASFIEGLRTLQQPTLSASIKANASYLKALLSIASLRKSIDQSFQNDQHPETSTGLRTHLYPDGSWDRMSIAHAHKKAIFDPRLAANVSVDPERVDLVFTWLEHSKTEHKTTFLLLTPYSPDYYATTLKENPESMQLEHTLRDRAAKLGIVLIGSFNPGTLDLEDNDFIDQIHWTTNAMTTYIRSIDFPHVSKTMDEAPSSN